MPEVIDIFRALSDEVRLRILAAVMGAELSVAELVEVLDLPQSTVSRHLKPLREAGLVETRREGTSVYYRRGALLSEPEWAPLLEKRLRALRSAVRDATAVRRVLDLRRQRSKDFFEKVAGRYETLTQPGGGWEALAAALAAGFAGQDVADLGAGEGALTMLLARFARSVVAVDQSKAMLREVREKAQRAGLGGRVKVAEGDLDGSGPARAGLGAPAVGRPVAGLRGAGSQGMDGRRRSRASGYGTVERSDAGVGGTFSGGSEEVIGDQ
jgi:DNA-binding transcriptional ArsR family regulator